MYNYLYKIKTSFLAPNCRRHGLKKTGFNLKIVYFYIRRKLDIIRCFKYLLIWLRTGSNLPDIIRFRSDNGKYFSCYNKLRFITGLAPSIPTYDSVPWSKAGIRRSYYCIQLIKF